MPSLEREPPEQGQTPPQDPRPLDPVQPGKARRSWARRLRALGLVALVLAVLAGGGLVGAEYYTSRPAFCGSCHIMDAYYRSWSHDVHGYKLGARCVDCHYAPGEQHTLHAKFKGLSQLASYFSGRYGASRPRAHVADASCQTSACHGDAAYLAKSLLIGETRKEIRIVGTQMTEVERRPTVQFVHEKHLRSEPKHAETQAQLTEVVRRLQDGLAPELYERICAAAVSVEPTAQREHELRLLLRDAQAEELAADAVELSRLEHQRARLEQLTNLNCTACHSYDGSGQHHLLPVDSQTCFTCHFNNQAFNRDTGECLRCHTPPERKILIHEQPTTTYWRVAGTTSPAALGPVLMDHRDIVARKVECASCHMDVIQGQAVVTVRDCTHCHDQQKYLEGFEQRDMAKVTEYHRVHVAAQRAHCLDCHRAIQHRLVDPTHVGTTAGFLEPVLNDCQHCHPNHHHEQVELLLGTGGAGLAVLPNAMISSRLNCVACHALPGTDVKGDALIQATQSACLACHGEDYRRLFDQWRSELAGYLQEAETSLARADEQIDAWQARGQAVPAEVDELVEQARVNVQLVRAGNGIHNRNFALELLDLSIRNLDQAMGVLTAP